MGGALSQVLEHDGALAVAGVLLDTLLLVSVGVAVGIGVAIGMGFRGCKVDAWGRGLDVFVVAGVKVVFGGGSPV